MKRYIFMIMMLSVFLCLSSCGHDPLPEENDRTVISEETETTTEAPEAAVTDAVVTRKPKVRETETAVTETSVHTEPVFVMQPLANKPALAETTAPAPAETTAAATETVPSTEAPRTEAAPVNETAANETAVVTAAVQEGTASAEAASSSYTATSYKTSAAKTTTAKTTTAKTTTVKTTTVRTTTARTTTTIPATTTEPPVTTEAEEYGEEVFDSCVSLLPDGWYEVSVLDVIPDYEDNIFGWGIVLGRTDSFGPFCLNLDPELCERVVTGKVNSFRFADSELYLTQSDLYRRDNNIFCRPVAVADSAYFDDVRVPAKSSPGPGDEEVVYTITEAEDPIARNIDDLYYDVSIEGWFTASVVKTYNGDEGIGYGAIMRLFQDVPYYYSLPEDICSQIEAGGLYAFHIPKQRIRTGLDNLFMYEAGDINVLALIENQPLIDAVREPKAIEIGDGCWNVKYTR
ncbi:MAG: hypothetical protein J5501_09395 [Ruminococcus sp.]|nr:hypothetical protein [Ruminococcus sp.]